MTKPCKICGDPIDALIIRKRTVHCLSCSSKLTGTVNRKHGGSETREYARWTSMRDGSPAAHGRICPTGQRGTAP